MPALSCGDFFLIMVGRVAPLVHDADKLASRCQDSQVLDVHTWQENGGVRTHTCHGGRGSPFGDHCRQLGPS